MRKKKKGGGEGNCNLVQPLISPYAHHAFRDYGEGILKPSAGLASASCMPGLCQGGVREWYEQSCPACRGVSYLEVREKDACGIYSIDVADQ